MSDDGGWDDLFGDEDVPAQMAEDFARAAEESRQAMNLSISADDWVPAAREVVKESSPEPIDDVTGLFGDDKQFHPAWQHWKGMPEFHMENLTPDSTLVVKFRTPEARADFAEKIGLVIRKEEPRGVWYPKIEIAHFWDKRYRDATAETPDANDAPILSEDDEPDEVEDETDEEIV